MSSPQYPYAPPPPPPLEDNGSRFRMALAAAAIIASLAANGFLLYEVHNLQTDTDKSREIMQNEIDTIKENSTVMTASQRKHMEELREEVDNRSRQANQAASQVKREALSYADEKAKEVDEQRQKGEQKLSSSITDVAQKADTANAKLADVNNDVTSVKSDLASTKTDLTQTKSDLKKVSGDLGITTGFVATNSSQIDELRKRGERNIIEFSLKKEKNLQKVGDISVRLEKSDPKHNKFSVIVLADDKTVEKKDKSINEPLQFYVSKSLYEVVVNSVGKDQIAGYLSTPKYQNR